MKKCLTMLFIIIITIGLLTGYVSASSASISASAKTVTVGNTVKINVSFGEKVKMAEFDLSYDKSKFEFVSTSKGAFGNKYSFVDSAAKAETSNVTLTFKAKATGSASFKISNLKIATETERIASQPMSNTSVSVTVNAKKTTSTTSTNKGTTTSKPNNSNNSSTTNKVEEQPKEEPKKEEEPVQPAPNRLITLYEQGVTTLEDKIYNIMVKALPVAISDDARLEVTAISPRNENYPIVSDILSDVEGQKTYFDIKLLKDNKSVQPNGYVTVYIPIPEKYNNENLELYYVDVQNGKYELIKGKLQGEDYSFTTNHFSTYVLVEKPEPQVVETSTEVVATEVVKNIIDFFTNVKCLYIVISILAVIVIVLLIVKLKRSRND